MEKNPENEGKIMKNLEQGPGKRRENPREIEGKTSEKGGKTAEME